MIIGILVWGAVTLSLLDVFGLKNVKSEDLTTLENVIVFVVMVAGFLSVLLLSNLISYIILARVLKAQRTDLEHVIAEHAKLDSRDNNPTIQRFYVWCLDIAYRDKT